MNQAKDILAGADGQSQLVASYIKDLSALDVWKVEPLGHTEYQIRNFILNRRDCPTDDLRYRQILRELWGRKGAYDQDVQVYREQEINAELLSAERDRLRITGWWMRIMPFGGRTLKAKLAMLDLKISTAKRVMEDTLVDLRERVMRETSVFLDELGKVHPKEGDRLDIEHENWTEKAKVEKKLEELMSNSTGNGSDALALGKGVNK